MVRVFLGLKKMEDIEHKKNMKIASKPHKEQENDKRLPWIFVGFTLNGITPAFLQKETKAVLFSSKENVTMVIHCTQT